MKKPQSVRRRLQELLKDRVSVDERTLERHATDQSIYRILPLAVVFPRDVEDITKIVTLAAAEGVPLHPRSGGSGTAGGALGPGIVIAFDKSGPMNRIVSIDADNQLADAEGAVIHDALQRALGEKGLFLPADPSSGAISLFSGNIATKASGPHALRHGSIDSYLQSVRLVTAYGEVVDTADPHTVPASIGRDVETLKHDLTGDADACSLLASRVGFKTASGYNLFTFLRTARQTTQEPPARATGDAAEHHAQQPPGQAAALAAAPAAEHVTQLMAGSVGTLGVITGGVVAVERRREGKGMTLLYFRSLKEAGEAVLHIRQMDVDAIEIINHSTLALIRERGRAEVPRERCHMVMVEYSGPDSGAYGERIHNLIQRHRYDLAEPPVSVGGGKEQKRLWKVRKALLPLVRGQGHRRRALSIVNDVGVPVASLPDFIEDVEAIFGRLGLEAAIYGHAGSGNLHLRPFFDADSPDLKQLLERVAGEVYKAVFDYNGTITAEHGMGRLRAPFLKEEWGESVYGYMRRVKRIFDPDNLFNPEAMFSNRPVTDLLKY